MNDTRSPADESGQIVIFLEEAATYLGKEPWASKIKELLAAARQPSPPSVPDLAWTAAQIQSSMWLADNGHDAGLPMRQAMDEYYPGGFNQFLVDRSIPLGI